MPTCVACVAVALLPFHDLGGTQCDANGIWFETSAVYHLHVAE